VNECVGFLLYIKTSSQQYHNKISLLLNNLGKSCV